MDKTEAPSDLFPERLRTAREMLGLEQAQLAAKAGLPPTSISHFEAGSRKPSFDNLRRLAYALEVTTDYLIGRADKPEMVTEATPLYRDIQKLNAKDRELAQEFIAMLARRKEAKDEKK